MLMIEAILTRAEVFYVNSPFICMCFHWFVDVMASLEKFYDCSYMLTLKTGFQFHKAGNNAIYIFFIM